MKAKLNLKTTLAPDLSILEAPKGLSPSLNGFQLIATCFFVFWKHF
jgi:hypothetical protein